MIPIDPMVAVWFGALVLFLLIESQTVSVVSLWFAAGALAGMITALCSGPLWLQAVLFFAVSIALLACLRPIVRKYFTPRLAKTNVDSVVGTTGPVMEDIDNLQSTGRVKLGGMEWSARSTTGQPIAKDTIVRVDRIEGNKVFVSIT